MGVPFNKLPTGDPHLDRVQENIAELARRIPAASAPNVLTVTSDYKVNGTEDVVHVDAQSGPVRVTLGAAKSSNRPLTIKQVNAPSSLAKVNPVTVVTADGSKTIAGQSSYSLDDTGTGSVTITATDGQHWPSSNAPSASIATKYVAGQGIQIAGNIISSTATGSALTPAQSISILTGLQPPLNPVAVFVAPWGSDGNSGSSWAQAFGPTLDHALDVLEIVGGGELHVYSPGDPGNRVDGNIWLRGDGLKVPGWHGDFTLRVIGYGTQHQSFGFACAKINGGGTDQRTPFIWLAGTNQPKEFVNICDAAFINTFLRMWDYRRDLVGDIISSNITSWTRNADKTATVSLQLPPAANVSKFERFASPPGTVQLTIDPASVSRAAMCNIDQGHVVRVVSTDPNFDSGDFVVTQAIAAGVPYIIQYTQVTSGPAATATNAGTVQWSGLALSGRFQVTSSQPGNVNSATYRVVAAPTVADQVVVSDPYGGNPAGSPDGSFSIGTFPTSGTFANPGTWSLTDRYSFNPSGGQDFYNCQNHGRGAPAYDIPGNDPSLDIGASNDGRMRFYKCAPAGYSPVNGCPDLDRYFVAGLFDGGSHGASTLNMYDCRPAGGGFVYYESQSTSDGIDMRNVIGDVAFGVTADVHMLRVTGGANSINSSYFIDGVRNADLISGGYDIVIDQAPANCVIMNCGPVSAPGAIVLNCAADPHSLTPWQLGHVGIWNHDQARIEKLQQIIADVPAVRRALPLAMSRVTNMVPPDSSWNFNGGTVTTGIADPWGGTRAKKVTGGVGPVLIPFSSTFFSLQPGDTFVFGMMVRKDGGFSGSLNLGLHDSLGHIVASAFAHPSNSADWQLVGSSITVPAGTTGPWYVDLALTPLMTSGSGMEYCQPFLEYLPTATYSPAEIAIYVGTMGNRTRTLSPGTAGTLEGVPFVASGGLGVDSSVIVTPSGTALQAGNMPIYGADGVTVIARVPTVGSNANLTIPDFVASGASHAAGKVPDPGSTAGTTKFLREDATWSTPPAGDHKVLVDGSDTTADYLANKIESTSGNIAVTVLAGGGNEKLNLNVVDVPAGVVGADHFYQSNLTFSDFSGTWWLVSSNDTAKTRGSPGRSYWGNPVGFAVKAVRLQIAVFNNTITGTSPVMTFNITQNGTVVGSATLPINGSSATLDYDTGIVSVGSSTASDVWGVDYDSSGTFSTGTMSFTATARYYQ